MSNKFNKYLFAVNLAAYNAFLEWGQAQLTQFNRNQDLVEGEDNFSIRQVNLVSLNYSNSESHPSLVLHAELEYENNTQDTCSTHNVELDVSDIISGSLVGFKYIKNPDTIKRVLKTCFKQSPISLPKSVRKTVIDIFTGYLLLEIEHYLFDAAFPSERANPEIDASELQLFYLTDSST